MTKANKGDKINRFDCNRLQKSVMTACLSARRPDGQAEATAKAVCDEVVKWLEQRPDITSGDLRRITAKSLAHYDPEAAYLYTQTHITI